MTATVTQLRIEPGEVTWWPSLMNTRGAAAKLPWSDVFERLSRIAPFRGDEHPGWSAAVFRENKRGLENVERVTAAVLDYDGTDTIDGAVGDWGRFYGLLHTTKKHGDDAHRFRVILPLIRPVSAFEWSALWVRLNAYAGGKLDAAAKDASRFWYLPGVVDGGSFSARELGRQVLDVDEWLRKPDPTPKVETYIPPPRSQDEIEQRAISYIAKMDPAISGSGGHNATWQVAVALARGFCLGEEATYRILAREYNPRCEPGWKEKDLRHKANQAQNANRVPYGYLLDDPGREYSPRTHHEAPPLDPKEYDWIDESESVDDMGPGDPPVREQRHRQERQPIVAISMRDMFNAVVERARLGVPEFGVSTCHPVLDDLIGGFRKGKITALGARTSFGKSSYLIMVMDEAMRAGHRCILVSSEDSEDTFGQRFMARRASVNASRLRVNKCSDGEIQRMESRAKQAEVAPFFINAVGRNVEDVCEYLAELCKSEPPALVAFDYLQAMRTRRRSQDRRNEVTHIAQEIGSTIKNIGAAGIVVSQFKRPDTGNPNKRPTMFDLKESGDIENMVEHVILGHRENGSLLINVAKNKDGPMPEQDEEWLELPYDIVTASFKVGVRPPKPNDWIDDIGEPG